MGKQAYELRKPWAPDECAGVVIVDTVTGIAVPLSHGALLDCADADRFTEWAVGSDSIRDRDWCDVGALESAALRWRALRDAEPCPCCASVTHLSLANTRRGLWELLCLDCYDGANGAENIVGRGASREEAAEDWDARVRAEREAVA